MEQETTPKRQAIDGKPTIYIECFTPEYVALMERSYTTREEREQYRAMMDRRLMIATGETTDEVILEAINFLTWFTVWSKEVNRSDTPVQLRIAPEGSDYFPGSWRDYVGIDRIPRAKIRTLPF